MLSGGEQISDFIFVLMVYGIIWTLPAILLLSFVYSVERVALLKGHKALALAVAPLLAAGVFALLKTATPNPENFRSAEQGLAWLFAGASALWVMMTGPIIFRRWRLTSR